MFGMVSNTVPPPSYRTSQAEKEYWMRHQIGENMYEGTILEKLWWKYFPGVVVKIKWPLGENFIDPNCSCRPYLESNIGKQGWNWNWKIEDTNNNYILIKIRRSKSEHAPIISLMWS